MKTETSGVTVHLENETEKPRPLEDSPNDLYLDRGSLRLDAILLYRPYTTDNRNQISVYAERKPLHGYDRQDPVHGKYFLPYHILYSLYPYPSLPWQLL